MSAEQIVRAIVSSLWYNFETKDIILILETMWARLRRIGYSKEVLQDAELNDVVDLFYGMLVCLCGDYGTSPRFGWINDEEKDNIETALIEEINELKTMIESEPE